MAFRFRLDKVLNYRQKIVDQVSREVGEAARVVAQFNTRMVELQGQIDALLAEQKFCGHLDVQALNQRQIWIAHLGQRMQMLVRERDRAMAELDNRRARLTAVWRDLEVLKKLKERQKASWQQEQLRRENQDLDEIGQIRADRQQREKLAST